MFASLDETWLKLEKAAVVGGFLVMSTVVFADVVHRETAEVIAGLEWREPVGADAEALDATILEDQRARHEGAKRTAVAVPIALWLLGWIAFRTATRDAMPHRKAAAWALAVPVVACGAAWMFVKVVPNGVIWAQTLALVLTIWVGFLGGSIATAEQLHLKIDAAEKLFDGVYKKYVSVGADVVAALFTGFLGVLGVLFCAGKYSLWSETDGAAGMFPGLPLPQWAGFAILPVTLFVIAVRFLALAWLRWHDRAPPPKHLGGLAAPEEGAA